MKGLSAIAALLFALGVAAAEYPLEKHMYVACAATNTLLATKLDEGTYQDAIVDEARRFSEMANDHPLVERLLASMQQRYDSGDMNLNEIVAMSQQCSESY